MKSNNEKRTLAIKLYDTGKYSITQIAEIVQAPRKTVGYWKRAERGNITSQKRVWVKKMYAGGLSVFEIANILATTRTTVWRFLNEEKAENHINSISMQ